MSTPLVVAIAASGVAVPMLVTFAILSLLREPSNARDAQRPAHEASAP